MASKTASGTAGYVSKGVYGGVVSGIGGDLLVDVAEHHPDRSNMKLTITHLTDVADAETLAMGMDSIVALAWQPEDGTDDDVRAVLTTQVTGIVTFAAGGTRKGWLWILHKGY